MMLRQFSMFLTVVLLLASSVNSHGNSGREVIKVFCPFDGIIAGGFNRVIDSVSTIVGKDYVYVNAVKDPALAIENDDIQIDCARGASYPQRKGVDVYKVRYPIDKVEFSVWSLKETVDKKPYEQSTIGIWKNNKYSQNLSDLLGFKSAENYQSIGEAFKQLKSGTIDYILTNNWNIKNLWVDDKSQIEKNRAVVTAPMHVLINKNNPEIYEAVKQSMDGVVTAYPSIVRDHDKQILFSCSVHTGSPKYEEIYQIFSSIFQSIGYDFKMIYLPRKRETFALFQGAVDGTCGRNNTLFEGDDVLKYNYSSLIVPLIKPSIELLTSPGTERVSRLNGFKDGVKVVYVIGTTVIEDYLSKVNNVSVYQAPSESSALKMLTSGRMDYFMGLSFLFGPELERLQFDLQATPIGGMGEVLMHPYLHHRHADIYSRVLEAIQKYTEDRGSRSIMGV